MAVEMLVVNNQSFVKFCYVCVCVKAVVLYLPAIHFFFHSTSFIQLGTV